MNSDNKQEETINPINTVDAVNTVNTVNTVINDKKKKKKTTSNATEKKHKIPVHIALLKKKMEEEAETRKKLQEEEERLQKILQAKEEEYLKNQKIAKEKKTKTNAKKKEKAILFKREESLRRLGLDPSNINSKNIIVSSISKNKQDHNKDVLTQLELKDEVSENKQHSDSDQDDWEYQMDNENKEESSKTFEKPVLSKSTEEKQSKENLDHSKVLRAPICCVLGGVDSGKTTLIDKIKNTNVQVNEAGGITQKISAIWVNNTSKDYNTTGLLILDTPGHDAFHSLRHLGASICNIVFLMIDITADVRPDSVE
jgi:translation initiation factor 5B